MATKAQGTKKSAGKKVSSAAQMRTKKGATSAKEWKKSPRQGIELEVPSGNVALVRRVGMQAFLRKGMIPNSLRELAFRAIRSGTVPEMTVAEMNEVQIQELLEMIDGVVVYSVVEPAVAPVPADEDDRDDDILYVDEIDLDDKMFVFQFACGGTTDLGSFRAQSPGSLDGLPGGQNVESAAK